MSDIDEILKTGGISTGFITVILIALKIFKSLNNKRFHSSCCGAETDVIIAVNSITEEEKKKHLTTPELKPVEAKTEVPSLKLDDPPAF